MNLLRIQNGGQSWAVDDVSGAALDPILVQAARQVEMEYFRRILCTTRYTVTKPGATN